jgi:hypothetical protein
MKITLKRLRQIITEEVIKEEISPEVAGPAIAAMLRGLQPDETSDIFGDVFTEMYGEEALKAQAAQQAQDYNDEEERFPTEYQAGGAYGDRPVVGIKEGLDDIIAEELSTILIEQDIPDLAKAGPELEKLIQQILPAIEAATEGNEDLKKLSLQRLFQLLQKEGGVEIQERLRETIQEEYYLHSIEEYQKTLNEAPTGKKHSDYLRAKYADVTPEDPYAKYAVPGPEDDPKYYKAAPRTDREPLLGPLTSRGLRVATIQVAQLAQTWRNLIGQGVDMRAVIDQAKSEGVDTLEVLMNVHKMIQDTYNKQGHGEYTPSPDEQKFIQPKDPLARAVSDESYESAASHQRRAAKRRQQAASTYGLEESIRESIRQLKLEF